jgi:hypothetical protein
MGIWDGTPIRSAPYRRLKYPSGRGRTIALIVMLVILAVALLLLRGLPAGGARWPLLFGYQLHGVGHDERSPVGARQHGIRLLVAGEPLRLGIEAKLPA